MILEVGKYERNAFYFDCFLSGYDREREYLFVGGYAALKIKTILLFMSMEDIIENYAKYLQLLQKQLEVQTKVLKKVQRKV